MNGISFHTVLAISVFFKFCMIKAISGKLYKILITPLALLKRIFKLDSIDIRYHIQVTDSGLTWKIPGAPVISKSFFFKYSSGTTLP